MKTEVTCAQFIIPSFMKINYNWLHPLGIYIHHQKPTNMIKCKEIVEGSILNETDEKRDPESKESFLELLMEE